MLSCKGQFKLDYCLPLFLSLSYSLAMMMNRWKSHKEKLLYNVIAAERWHLIKSEHLIEKSDAIHLNVCVCVGVCRLFYHHSAVINFIICIRVGKCLSGMREKVSCIVLPHLIVSVKLLRTSAPYDIINLLYWIFIVCCVVVATAAMTWKRNFEIISTTCSSSLTLDVALKCKYIQLHAAKLGYIFLRRLMRWTSASEIFRDE